MIFSTYVQPSLKVSFRVIQVRRFTKTMVSAMLTHEIQVEW